MVHCQICGKDCTNNAGLQSHLRRNASCYDVPTPEEAHDGFVHREAGVDVPLTMKYQDWRRHQIQTKGWRGNRKQ